MPVDDSLPPPRLTRTAAAEEIVRHFVTWHGLRVDLQDMPAAERLSLASARIPDPPEALLLDRVLQLVPPGLRGAVQRVLIVDNGVVGQLGSYRTGIIRLYTPVLRLTLPDPQYSRRFSYFATTVAHEFGHAVFATHLTPAQRALVVDLYLEDLIATGQVATADPTLLDAEHHFVRLFTAALLRFGTEPGGTPAARELLRELGLQ